MSTTSERVSGVSGLGIVVFSGEREAFFFILAPVGSDSEVSAFDAFFGGGVFAEAFEVFGVEDSFVTSFGFLFLLFGVVLVLVCEAFRFSPGAAATRAAKSGSG